MVLAHPMNAMLVDSLHRKNLHLPEISDTDRDLDSSTITYSSVSLSFCELGPPPPFPQSTVWLYVFV